MNLRGITANYAHLHDAKGGRSKDGRAIVIWASGTNGRILRSADSGKTWKQLHVEGGETLDFRGVQSFGAATAYAMSIGTEGKSRIYKTTDAGETWRLQYSDKRPELFLDGLVCRNEKDCFAISDPIDGKFLLLRTTDGEHWKELPREQRPAALPKDGVFAASNSALILCGDQELFFGTGGPAARVFHSVDLGQTWTVAETPILSGNDSSGIFSLRCSGAVVAAVGGDFRKPADVVRVAAYSLDHGATWKLADQGPGSFCSGVELVDGKTWIAVGPAGEYVSVDRGAHWKPAGSAALNAVFALPGGIVLGAGPKGVVELLGDEKPRD